jgi:hypothetical protein
MRDHWGMCNDIVLQFLFLLCHSTEEKRIDMLRTLDIQKLILPARSFIQYLTACKNSGRLSQEQSLLGK